MHIEIICIGSELLLGFVNTNNSYISEKLATIGLKVDREITVGDNFSELKDVFSESLNRSDIIIATGGLGPTFDDITREVVTKVLKKKLVFNKEVMKSITEHFARLKDTRPDYIGAVGQAKSPPWRIKMPKSNEKQAYILEGAEMLPNNAGTAPGQIIEIRKSSHQSKLDAGQAEFKIQNLILLPGPPREMNPMFETMVLPYLKKRFEKGILKTKIFHTAGLPESVVNEKIKGIVDIEKDLARLTTVGQEGGEITFTILTEPAGVNIKMMVSGTDEMLIDKTIKNLCKEFYDVLGENIYGEDNQSLESVVGEKLIRKRKTLAVAESCTGGLIAHRLTNVAGSSLYFKEAVVTYSDISKKRLLGVKDETLNKYGAVSKEVAKEMAESIKKIAGTSFGLSTTGIAGPKPSSTGKPVGLVFICIASDKETAVKQFNFTGSRLEIKNRIATAALDSLRKNLL